MLALRLKSEGASLRMSRPVSKELVIMSAQELARSDCRYYFAAGVLKLDYKVAGFRDLKRLAQEWAKDPGFHEIIVRHVSETNCGIQFVYFSDSAQKGNVRRLREEVEKKIGRVYAVDCAEYTSNSPVWEELVLLKSRPTPATS
jgi:hypothetical protein